MKASARLSPAAIESASHRSGRVPVAFGPRFFLLLLLGLVWIGPAWREPRFLWAMFAWDSLALLLWAWDLMRLPKPGELVVRRAWNAPVALATAGKVEIELHNLGRRGVSAVAVDEVPGSLRRELATVEASAPAGGAGRASYDIVPLERGDVQLGRVGLRYQSALRLAERWAVADLAQTVRVYPNLEEAGRQRIFLIRSRQIELEKRLKRQRGYGREFESLREYRAGDEARDICWTATARRGKLITKVFQTERSQTVWILLDAGRLLRARVTQLSKLDFSVNAALSLAQVAFYSGDRVALLAYGRRTQQRLGPGRGAPHLRALVESLALVHGEAHEADHQRAANSLMTTQKRRSLVVWLTDLAETASTPEVIESAARLAARHLVLLVVIAQPELRRMASERPQDPTEMYRYTAALEIIQRRDIFLRQLRQQGALTLEVEPGRLSTALINGYLEVKERSLL
jgi:uncharacterized protein (DUF58 family)